MMYIALFDRYIFDNTVFTDKQILLIQHKSSLQSLHWQVRSHLYWCRPTLDMSHCPSQNRCFLGSRYLLPPTSQKLP